MERLTDAQRAKVEANIGLIGAVVARCYGADNPRVDDLVQDAAIGLMRAVQLHDPAKGAALSTYADYHMRANMAKGTDRDNETIHVPAHAKERRIGREHHAADAARASGIGRINDESAQGFVDRSSRPDHNAMRAETVASVRAAIGKLKPQQRIVVERCMLGKESQTIVGRDLGVTCERVRMVRIEATNLLQAMLSDQVQSED